MRRAIERLASPIRQNNHDGVTIRSPGCLFFVRYNPGARNISRLNRWNLYATYLWIQESCESANASFDYQAGRLGRRGPYVVFRRRSQAQIRISVTFVVDY